MRQVQLIGFVALLGVTAALLQHGVLFEAPPSTTQRGANAAPIPPSDKAFRGVPASEDPRPSNQENRLFQGTAAHPYGSKPQSGSVISQHANDDSVQAGVLEDKSRAPQAIAPGKRASDHADSPSTGEADRAVAESKERVQNLKPYTDPVDFNASEQQADQVAPTMRSRKRVHNSESKGNTAGAVPDRRQTSVRGVDRVASPPRTHKPRRPLMRKSSAQRFQEKLMQRASEFDSVLNKGENPWEALSGPTEPHESTYQEREAGLVAVELWSHRDVEASHDFKYPFCRIYGACQAKSGRIVLPKALKAHKAKLARCGVLSSQNFYDPSNTSDPVYTLVQRDPLSGRNLRDLDLVERHPPRRASHHFLADLLKVLFFIDVVYRTGSERPGPVGMKCLAASGETFDGPCSPNADIEHASPAMYVRMESFVDDAWVPHVLQMLARPESVLHHTPFLFLHHFDVLSKVQNDGKEPLACFRSITTSSYPYGQIPAEALGKSNPFFLANGIDREAHPTKSRTADGKPACSIDVLVDRAIEVSDTADLSRDISAGCAKDGFSCTVSRLESASLTFDDTRRALQRSDVYVAPHGPSLANAVFMPQHAAVVEVHPFAWIPGMFQGISGQLRLTYTKMSSMPDVDSFTDCLRHYNSENTLGVSELTSAMRSAEADFLADGKSSFRLDGKLHEFTEVQKVRQCARSQRHVVPINSLVGKVRRIAALQCGGET